MECYKLSLVVYADRYTAKIVWWLDNTHKVATSCYMHKEINDCDSVVSLLASCIKLLVELYKIDLSYFSV